MMKWVTYPLNAGCVCSLNGILKHPLDVCFDRGKDAVCGLNHLQTVPQVRQTVEIRIIELFTRRRTIVFIQLNS